MNFYCTEPKGNSPTIPITGQSRAITPSGLKIGVCAVLFFAALPPSLEAATSAQVARVEQVETGGRNIRGRDSEIGVCQIRPIALKDVNRVRKVKGLKPYSISDLWIPELNRLCAGEYLDIQAKRLRKHLKREPTEAEQYRAFRYGFAGFKRSTKTKTK